MRILTLVRQVPDAEESVHIQADVVDLSASKLVMDTMDEYGVEEALRLREAGTPFEIVALAIGPTRLTETLRTALAMGVDRAIHVETHTRLEPIALSKIAATIATEEEADLIFTGGQQADWDSQALGAALAERLHWPQITWTTLLALDGRTLSGRHDIDEGTESFSVDLPAVVTTQQGLNEPRYPTLPGIMKAKRKETRKETLDRFAVSPSQTHMKSEIQLRTRLNKILDGKDSQAAAAKLVDLLRHEARVIA